MRVTEFEYCLTFELCLITPETPLMHIKKILDTLVKTFPEEERSDIYTSFLRWADTFRLAVEVSEIKPVPFNVFEEFIRKFIEIYNGDLSQCSFDGWVSEHRETFLLLLPPPKLTQEQMELVKELNKVAYDACMEELRNGKRN